MSAVSEALSGIVNGLSSGIAAFFIVLLLSIVYKYFTNEKLSYFIGILFGLGFLGISGGLLAILDQPSISGVLEVIVLSIFTIWGVTTGDKIADKIPKKSASAIIDGIKRGKTQYTTIKLPDARLIYDMTGEPRVPDSLKEELSLREFTLPGDIPLEEIANRVKRRLITDWGVGDVELELDQEFKVIHLAIAAKTRGLSMVIPKGQLGIPIECKVIPSNLSPDDIVTIYFDNGEVLEACDLKGVDEEHRIITIAAEQNVLEKIRGVKASLVVVLPSPSMQTALTISVKQESGEIEEFQFERMRRRLKRAGVTDELAIKIVKNVQGKIDKMDPPISTRTIKDAIIEELKKENPEAAKKFSRGIWSLSL
jgi:hypothetical protein